MRTSRSNRPPFPVKKNLAGVCKKKNRIGAPFPFAPSRFERWGAAQKSDNLPKKIYRRGGRTNRHGQNNPRRNGRNPSPRRHHHIYATDSSPNRFFFLRTVKTESGLRVRRDERRRFTFFGLRFYIISEHQKTHRLLSTGKPGFLNFFFVIFGGTDPVGSSGSVFLTNDTVFVLFLFLFFPFGGRVVREKERETVG